MKKRNIEAEDKLILYVGPGLTTLPDPNEIRKGEKIICFDPAYSKESRKRHLPSHLANNPSYNIDLSNKDDGMVTLFVDPLKEKGVKFIAEPYQNNGLPNDSVDEIRMCNVLNDPNTSFGIIREIIRTLRTGGFAYIEATNTPENFSLEDLRKWSKRDNLSLEVLVHSEDPREFTDEEREMIRENKGFIRYLTAGAYAAKLTKN